MGERHIIKENVKLGKSRKLTKEENYQLSIGSIERIKPFLIALERRK